MVSGSDRVSTLVDIGVPMSAKRRGDPCPASVSRKAAPPAYTDEGIGGVVRKRSIRCAVRAMPAALGVLLLAARTGAG